MEELEQHLKAVLHRIDPPPGFEARAVRRRSRPGLKWAAALATAAMIVAGVYWQGEIAKERVMVALKLTGTKLQQIQEKVDHAQ